MRIVIAGLFEYPEGSAAASRVRYYAQGFSESGHEVYVVSMNPYIIRPHSFSENGIWEKDKDVNYCLVFGQDKPHSRGLLSHTITHFSCMHNCSKYANKVLEDLHMNGPIDAIIGYSNWYVGMSKLPSFSKKRKIPLIWDVVEWHEKKYIKGGFLNPLHLNFLLGFHVLLPKADGIIAITSFLEKHFASKNIPVVRVPSFIDPDEFIAKIPDTFEKTDEEYQFTYLGRMDGRDRPLMIVKAIQEIVNSNYKIKLNVIGTEGKSGFAKITREYVEADPLLARHVKFWGKVPYELLYERFALTDCFIFNRENSRQAQCCFPTRLPEFLAAGKPVIASGVCDIAKYLENDKDAIIVDADSIDSLVAGMKRVVDLPDGGKSIGESGREKCYSVFNYHKCSQKVLDFIQKIIIAK